MAIFHLKALRKELFGASLLVSGSLRHSLTLDAHFLPVYLHIVFPLHVCLYV